jgi:hypothetical protein
MVAGLTYSAYGTLLAKMLAVNPATTLTADNTDLLNAMIDYAELRILRELDFLGTQTEVDSSDLTPGTRTMAVPGSLIIVNDIQVVTPASTAAAAGTLVPLQRTSLSFLNYFWPSAATQDVPQFWTLSDNTTIVLGPTPDAAYRLHCVGVVRPQSLYQATSGTYISLNLPDVLVAASMVWGSGGILQNFGAQADDPKMAQSWETQYQTLKAGVDVEALRQKAWSVGWQPYSPSPGAEQSRTG